MPQYTIGTIDGQKVRAIYTRDGQSSLPELLIKCGRKTLGSYRGSSLGPCNASCDPNESDLSYWQSLAGLPADDAQIARSMRSVKASISRATAGIDDHYAERTCATTAASASAYWRGER